MAKTIRIHLSPAILAVTAVAIAGAVGAAIWLAGLAQDCERRWAQSTFQWQYRDGQCMVLAGSKWLPETAIKVVVVGRDQKTAND